MDLNTIVIFVNVVEAGSFVGAARAAQVPKSTVARRIDELEESLGVRLLHRSTRKQTVTEAGRAFYERARQIVDDIEDATASVSSHQREPRGKLRFTTSVLLAETFIGGWAVEYLRRYPKVELDMVVAQRKVDLLAEGFDIAIRVGRIEPTAQIVRRLAPAPQYLCASPSYLARRGVPEATEQLRDHECIVFSPDRTRAPWELESDSGESASVAVSGSLLVNSHRVAIQACLDGFGIAQLPALICCNELRSGRLVRLLPEWSRATRWLHALYPSRHHIPATVRTFLEFMTEKLNPPPWIIG